VAQDNRWMKQYLAFSDIIDWKHPEVFKLARQLSDGMESPKQISKRCFEWVRDEICHSHDYQMNPVTCAASEVLQSGTGYCFAKSHLLAALLRANSIPTGLCYQRLVLDQSGRFHCLHGLNAIYLGDIGWYRVDARGNRDGIDAQFSPPMERLAFQVEREGEADLPEIWPEPISIVVKALRTFKTYDALAANLPDIALLPVVKISE
jgi:transglutaminase-like putative cysteine protease